MALFSFLFINKSIIEFLFVKCLKISIKINDLQQPRRCEYVIVNTYMKKVL